MFPGRTSGGVDRSDLRGAVVSVTCEMWWNPERGFLSADSLSVRTACNVWRCVIVALHILKIVEYRLPLLLERSLYVANRWNKIVGIFDVHQNGVQPFQHEVAIPGVLC